MQKSNVNPCPHTKGHAHTIRTSDGRTALLCPACLAELESRLADPVLIRGMLKATMTTAEVQKIAQRAREHGSGTEIVKGRGYRLGGGRVSAAVGTGCTGGGVMELKPCPFCDAEADIHVVDVTRSQDLRFKYEYQPGCETDECPGEWGSSSYCSADEAYEKWNTRAATDPLLKEMAEALEWISEDGHAMASMTIGSRQRLVEVLQKYREQAGCGCGDCLER